MRDKWGRRRDEDQGSWGRRGSQSRNRGRKSRSLDSGRWVLTIFEWVSKGLTPETPSGGGDIGTYRAAGKAKAKGSGWKRDGEREEETGIRCFIDVTAGGGGRGGRGGPGGPS